MPALLLQVIRETSISTRTLNPQTLREDTYPWNINVRLRTYYLVIAFFFKFLLI